MLRLVVTPAGANLEQAEGEVVGGGDHEFMLIGRSCRDRAETRAL